MQVPLNEILTVWLPHLGWSVIITSCLSTAWYLLQIGFKANQIIYKVENEWADSVERQKDQGDQLHLAMTNHLPHIEAATERTAQSVEKMAQAIAEQSVVLGKIQTLLEMQGRFHGYNGPG
jgi:hypothetical protein